MENEILIVEDEVDISEILRDYMQKEGYRTSIINTGGGVVDYVKKNSPSLILLDLMLPDIDGISICRDIRKFSSVPIMMITAKVDEIDRILGIEIGADDYICKPFSPREVTARVKAILRRVNKDEIKCDTLKTGPIFLDRETRIVKVYDNELKLTPSEFDILAVLMSSPGRVFTRTNLIEQVHGYCFEGYDRTIDFHIKNLRKKLGEDLNGRRFIHAVYGVGYKLSLD